MANTPPALATPSESTGVSAQASIIALHELQPPDNTREPSHVQPVMDHGNHNRNLDSNETLPSLLPLPLQVPPPPPRARLWATIVQTRLDEAIYLALFLFVGLPIY